MSKASAEWVFTGFRLGENLVVDFLQFSYDTVIIRNGSWSNLWFIK